jgi:glutamate/tyrosine decarboxylase-like PLP-dependent enzyme
VHLTRRARGIPFWFSLAVHGTDAYAAAVERTLAVTRQGAARSAPRGARAVAEPELSILAFRRHGWGEDDYHRWARAPARGGHGVRVPDDRARARPWRGWRS